MTVYTGFHTVEPSRETYDYVTSCSADVSKTTVGKVTFSNYRIFEDTLLEGYEGRAEKKS